MTELIKLGTSGVAPPIVSKTDAFGHMNVSPWLKAGYEIKCYTATKGNAKGLWGLNKVSEERIDEKCADFYLLELISSGVLYGKPAPSFNPDYVAEFGSFIDKQKSPGTLEGVQLLASLRLTALEAHLADLMRRYFFYACARELRYCDVLSGVTGRTIWKAVAGWKLISEHFGGETAAKWMADVFFKGSWISHYGGKTWANCATHLAAYEKGKLGGKPFGPRQWVDRAFTLQHNSGCALNKLDWGKRDHPGYSYKWPRLDILQTVLVEQSNTIDGAELLDYASKSTAHLWKIGDKLNGNA